MFTPGAEVDIYTEVQGHVGRVAIESVGPDLVHAQYRGELLRVLETGMALRAPLGVDWISTLLSALNPYKI